VNVLEHTRLPATNPTRSHVHHPVTETRLKWESQICEVPAAGQRPARRGRGVEKWDQLQFDQWIATTPISPIPRPSSPWIRKSARSSVYPNLTCTGRACLPCASKVSCKETRNFVPPWSSFTDRPCTYTPLLNSLHSPYAGPLPFNQSFQAPYLSSQSPTSSAVAVSPLLFPFRFYG